MTPMSGRLFLVLIFLAILIGGGLRLSQAPSSLSPPRVIPTDAPLIEPREVTRACAAEAKFNLIKLYGVDGQQNIFKLATRIDRQTWRVTGEIRAYVGNTVQIYPYEWINGGRTIGVNIHP